MLPGGWWQLSKGRLKVKGKRKSQGGGGVKRREGRSLRKLSAEVLQPAVRAGVGSRRKVGPAHGRATAPEPASQGGAFPQQQHALNHNCEPQFGTDPSKQHSRPAPLTLDDSALAVPEHYAQLGLKQDASLGEIRAAYHRLILKFHPDRLQAPAPASSSTAAQQAALLNAAWACLSNPEARAEYDRQLQRKRGELTAPGTLDLPSTQLG